MYLLNLTIEEKSEKAYQLIKDFAISEITQPLTQDKFISGIKLIETQIKEFIDDSSSEISSYQIYSDEVNLDITIQIFKSKNLWAIEYQDLNKNINFSVEKFIGF